MVATSQSLLTRDSVDERLMRLRQLRSRQQRVLSFLLSGHAHISVLFRFALIAISNGSLDCDNTDAASTANGIHLNFGVARLRVMFGTVIATRVKSLRRTVSCAPVIFH